MQFCVYTFCLIDLLLLMGIGTQFFVHDLWETEHLGETHPKMVYFGIPSSGQKQADMSSWMDSTPSDPLRTILAFFIRGLWLLGAI